ncbi:type 4a pilus biogenesis protein PilO [Veronia pacifica]|uniref:Pilus assembly protein PilP n=1 Tax=Veronia pacifica TaxID=1080227 RepID=A0A1C3EGM6_9GAMM|nr:type 4a pilus biogenesis protein PilO [Veronia pacifica]ODA32364.1 hypothetical protein A8L45_12900 [Veronia pacifica]
MADWRDFELEEIPEWSSTAQHILLGLGALSLIGLSIFFFLLPLSDEIKREVTNEEILKAQFRTTAQQVAALPDVDEQIKTLQSHYDYLSRQLPKEHEMASMLSDINEIGVDQGLTFDRLEFQDEKRAGWLYEIPLTMNISGEYDSLGLFNEAISLLPRIVALQDFSLRHVSPEESDTLTYSVSAVTYQFIEREQE